MNFTLFHSGRDLSGNSLILVKPNNPAHRAFNLQRLNVLPCLQSDEKGQPITDNDAFVAVFDYIKKYGTDNQRLKIGLSVYEWEVRGYYAHGWEVLTTEYCKVDAMRTRADYDENERGIAHCIKKVKISY